MDVEQAWKDMWDALGRFTATEWKFVTSRGGNVSVGTPEVRVAVGATGGTLWVSNGGKPIALSYGGLGASVGFNAVPFVGNLSFSMTDMPSAGTIYKLPYAGSSLSLGELRGPAVWLEVGADAGAGRAQCLMFMGASRAVAGMVPAQLLIPAMIASACACVRFGGMYASVLPFNVGVSAYVGAVH